MNLSDIDLNDLDFSNVSNWPTPIRLLTVAIVFVAVLGLGYWFDLKDQQLRLEQVEKKEAELKASFEDKAAKAANLEAYEQQLEEMRQSFGTMLRQLPNKTQVAGLLVDVSQSGLASGLEFELFRPRDEIPKEFYAELPISVKVKGTYHEFGTFVSAVAALPRIVTVHDILISPGEEGNELTMELTAKTYRYLEEEEG